MVRISNAYLYAFDRANKGKKKKDALLDVFGKSTITSYTSRCEMLAKEFLTFSAVVTPSACF